MKTLSLKLGKSNVYLMTCQPACDDSIIIPTLCYQFQARYLRIM